MQEFILASSLSSDHDKREKQTNDLFGSEIDDVHWTIIDFLLDLQLIDNMVFLMS